MQVVIKGFELLFVLWTLFSLSLGLGFLLLGVAPAYYLLYRWFRNKLYHTRQAVLEEKSKLFNVYTHRLTQLEDVLIEGNLSGQDRCLRAYFNDFLKEVRRQVIVHHSHARINQLLMTVISATTILVIANQIGEGTFAVAQVLVELSFTQRSLSNIVYYAGLGASYQQAKASQIRVGELLALSVQVEGEHQLTAIETIAATVCLKVGEHTLLKKHSLFLAKNQLIALLGSNGVGKTTLTKLLIGVYKSPEASIVYNNAYEIATLDSLHLRLHHVAYVSQRVTFGIQTVGELFGRVGYSQVKAVAGCLARLGADLPLPAQQLVSILLNVLKEKDLLIFDEPTANLDADMLAWFEQLLGSQLKINRMVILITHEASLTQLCDQVIQLEK